MTEAPNHPPRMLGRERGGVLILPALDIGPMATHPLEDGAPFRLLIRELLIRDASSIWAL